MRYNHFEYSEMLARRLAAISHTDGQCHFLRSDEVEQITDLEERISQISGMVLVAIDGHNADFNWENSDNLVTVPQYFITVMKQSPAGDIEAVHRGKAECREVLMQIVTRMLLDWNADEQGLGLLDADSLTMRGIGPIADNFYGVMLGFTLHEPTTFMLNPDMWL